MWVRKNNNENFPWKSFFFIIFFHLAPDFFFFLILLIPAAFTKPVICGAPGTNCTALSLTGVRHRAMTSLPRAWLAGVIAPDTRNFRYVEMCLRLLSIKCQPKRRSVKDQLNKNGLNILWRQQQNSSYSLRFVVLFVNKSAFGSRWSTAMTAAMTAQQSVLVTYE